MKRKARAEIERNIIMPSYIDQALQLAQEGMYRTAPNPRVGCVIVNRDGRVVGTGSTQQAGGAHAEIMALQSAAKEGLSVEGATAYVTLEPCAHHGRTGPCCDALINAGIRRVVASLEDPNPLVAGKGFARLLAAGVSVDVGEGAAASRELNIGFFSRMVRGTPWVRMKVAASLDGTIALQDGSSQWITSKMARVDGHAWRARACAVLTGIGTVQDDNPRLDVREVITPRQPHVVVVDSLLRTPTDAHIFLADRLRYIYCGAPEDTQFDSRKRALEDRGAVVVQLPNHDGKVDLGAMLKDLGSKGINELHVEAGNKLNGSLVREELVDEVLAYIAPKLLGKGLPIANIGPLNTLNHAVELEFRSIELLGPDLRVAARVRGRDIFSTAEMAGG